MSLPGIFVSDEVRQRVERAMAVLGESEPPLSFEGWLQEKPETPGRRRIRELEEAAEAEREHIALLQKRLRNLRAVKKELRGKERRAKAGIACTCGADEVGADHAIDCTMERRSA